MAESLSTASGQNEVSSLSEVAGLICSGCAVVFSDGSDKALSFSVQGFETRSVQDPENDVTERRAERKLCRILENQHDPNTPPA